MEDVRNGHANERTSFNNTNKIKDTIKEETQNDITYKMNTDFHTDKTQAPYLTLTVEST